MVKPENVPPDAMYAAWKAMNAGMTLNDAISAALNAWPGMSLHQQDINAQYSYFVLPLPQEKPDGE